MRRSWLVALMFAASASAAMAERVEVRFLPSDQPAFYLQFDKDMLRMATTQQGLATAKPIKATGRPRTFEAEDGAKGTGYFFPQVALPAKPPGIAGASADFRIRRFSTSRGRPREPWVGASVRFTVRDASGVTWSYTVYSGVPEVETEAPAPAGGMPVMSVFSDLSGLTPKVETTVKGEEVRIGIRMWALNRNDRTVARRVTSIPLINGLQREGKSAPARIEVRDGAGAVVSAKDADLDTFGFG